MGTLVALTHGVKVSFTPPFDATDFVDISSYVKKIKTTMGKQHEMNRYEAGTCTLLLDNADGRFSPWNTSSPYYNQLTNNDASFQTGVGNWVHSTNCSIGQHTSSGMDFTTSLAMTSTAAGDMKAGTGVVAFAEYPTTPGTQWTGIASFYASSSTRNVLVSLIFYNSGGTILQTSAGTAVAETGVGQWTKATVTATAPANAASVSIQATVQATGAGGEIHLVDRAGMYLGTNTAWSPGQSIPLGPDCPVEFTATYSGTTYPAWYGYIDSEPLQWKGPLMSDLQVSASDGLKGLNVITQTGYDYANIVVPNDGATDFWLCNDSYNFTTAADSINSSGNLTITQGAGVGYCTGPTNPFDTLYGTGGLLNDPGLGVLDMTSGAYASGTLQTAVTGAVSFEGWFHVTADSYLMEGNSGAMIVHTTSGVVHAGYAGSNVSGGSSILSGWHHVALTFAASARLTLYVDGVQVQQVTPGAAPASWTDFAVGWDTVALFTGLAQGIAVYAGVELSATQVATHYTAGRAGWAKSYSGARITALLNAAGVPAGLQSVSTGDWQVQAVGETPAPTPTLSYIDVVTQTEESAFYQDASGNFCFRNRGWITTQTTSTVSQATFGDQSGQIHYEQGTPGMILDDIDLYNVAKVTSVGGTVQTSTVVNRYFPRTFTRSGVLHLSDSEGATHASYITGKFAVPLMRPQQLTVKLYTATGTNLPTLLTLANGLQYLVTLVRTMSLENGGAGSTYDQNVFIEGIDHDVVAGDRWDMTFHLTPVTT